MSNWYFVEWRSYLPGDVLVGGGFAFSGAHLLVAAVLAVAVILAVAIVALLVLRRLRELTRFAEIVADSDCYCATSANGPCDSCLAILVLTSGRQMVTP